LPPKRTPRTVALATIIEIKQTPAWIAVRAFGLYLGLSSNRHAMTNFDPFHFSSGGASNAGAAIVDRQFHGFAPAPTSRR
jgi:hypothetical protein